MLEPALAKGFTWSCFTSKQNTLFLTAAFFGCLIDELQSKEPRKDTKWTLHLACSLPRWTLVFSPIFTSLLGWRSAFQGDTTHYIHRFHEIYAFVAPHFPQRLGTTLQDHHQKDPLAQMSQLVTRHRSVGCYNSPLGPTNCMHKRAGRI